MEVERNRSDFSKVSLGIKGAQVTAVCELAGPRVGGSFRRETPMMDSRQLWRQHRIVLSSDGQH